MLWVVQPEQLFFHFLLFSASLPLLPTARTRTHTHTQKVLMQWKTADLSKHTHDDTTFSMTYGSENVTMVTNNGHMISAYLGEMLANRTSNPLENGTRETHQSPTHTESSYVKSMGKKIEEIEAQRKPPRPIPAPRAPVTRAPQRPSRPPLQRIHAPLRSTKSVPVYPSGKIEAPPTTKEGGGVYEVPIQRKQTSDERKGRRKKSSTPFAPCDEKSDKGPPSSHGKFRPAFPPYLHQKSDMKYSPPIQKRQSSKLPDTGEIYLEPSPRVRAKISQKRTHRSDSDIINIVCPTESSIDEAIEAEDLPCLSSVPEYSKPVRTPDRSPEHNGRNVAPKHKLRYLSTSSVPQNSDADPFLPLPSSVPPLAAPPVSVPQSLPPPPSTPAPPPPSSPTPSPPTSSCSLAAPSFPGPPTPPHVVEEDMKEVDTVFEAEDLVMQVKFSRDSNPIYDGLEALKIGSSLKSSDVTFHSFSTTMERRKSKRMSQMFVKVSPDQSTSPSPSTSPTCSTLVNSLQHNDSSELLSILSQDFPRRTPPVPPGGCTGEANGKPGDKKKVAPSTSPFSPPILPRASKVSITKTRAVENEELSSASDEVSPKPSKPPPIRPRKTPSASPPPDTAPQESNCPSNPGHYSRLKPLRALTTQPHPPQAPPTQRPGKQSSGENLNHGYAEVGSLSLFGQKADRNKSTDYPWVVGEGSVEEKNAAVAMSAQDSNNRRRPLPITPLVPIDVPGGDVGVGGTSGEGEGREGPPPKPPRVRHRREKMLEKGDGMSRIHKAVSSSDVLRVSCCNLQFAPTCASTHTSLFHLCV